MSRLRPAGFRPEGFRPDGFRPGLADAGPEGYYVYSQPTRDRDAVKTQVAHLDPGVNTYTFTGESDSVQYVYIRAVTPCGVADNEAIGPKLRRVAFDGDGALIPDVPNAPKGLTLTPGAGGLITATWYYDDRGQAVAPASFNIYTATGEDAFDYDTPAGNVTPSRGNSFGATFSNGVTARFVVRAVSAAGDEEDNTTEASATADSQAPTAPDDMTVELIA